MHIIYSKDENDIIHKSCIVVLFIFITIWERLHIMLRRNYYGLQKISAGCVGAYRRKQ